MALAAFQLPVMEDSRFCWCASQMHQEAVSAAASAEEKSKAQREAYHASSSGPSTSGRDATAGDAPILIMHGSRICP
jgi:hypothetical protein